MIDPDKPHVARQAAASPIGKSCKDKGSNLLVAWVL
jgi:hypothetical protein